MLGALVFTYSVTFKNFLNYHFIIDWFI